MQGQQAFPWPYPSMPACSKVYTISSDGGSSLQGPVQTPWKGKNFRTLCTRWETAPPGAVECIADVHRPMRGPEACPSSFCVWFDEGVEKHINFCMMVAWSREADFGIVRQGGETVLRCAPYLGKGRGRPLSVDEGKTKRGARMSKLPLGETCTRCVPR
jgi:hypothetical protein